MIGKTIQIMKQLVSKLSVKNKILIMDINLYEFSIKLLMHISNIIIIFIKNCDNPLFNILDVYRILIPFQISIFQILGKCRRPNIPEILSESIIKYIIKQIDPCVEFESCSGDITIKNGPRIESKCDSSGGPMSFGPTERWDYLYILIVDKFLHQGKLYIAPYSNKSMQIRTIPMGKNGSTFLDKINRGIRPHVQFNIINEHLKNINFPLIDVCDINFVKREISWKTDINMYQKYISLPES